MSIQKMCFQKNLNSTKKLYFLKTFSVSLGIYIHRKKILLQDKKACLNYLYIFFYRVYKVFYFSNVHMFINKKKIGNQQN